MNQNEIEAFLAVVRYGSISAAAENLFITQPALSARIKSLENELHAELLDRGRGQKYTRLTAAGKQFEPYARRWLRLWEETEHAMSGETVNKLVITSTSFINAYLMPEVYAGLSEATRTISFQFLRNNYYECYRLLEERAADIAFVSNLQYARDLLIYPLYKQEMVVLAGASSTFPERVHPKDLNVKRGLYSDWGEVYNRWHRYWFGDPDRMPIQTTDVVFAEQFLKGDDNWAIVPRTVANKFRQTNDMRAIELEDPPEARFTYMISRHRIEEHSVIDELLARFRDVVLSLGSTWVFERNAPLKGGHGAP